MSIQSDVEMIYIQSMEAYANRKQMPIERALQLFQGNQVLEKIIVQHEYLHQISFEEIMEYIESIIELNVNSLVIYHGSVEDFDDIDLQKSKDRRDFGKGFYTTVLKQQAVDWAYRKSLRENKSKYYVHRYLFVEEDFLKVKRFDSLSKEWLEFIKENRSKGGTQHAFDVVIGPVADDNTMETVQLYISGVLTADEAVERLRYNNVNNQVTFHTEKALKALEYMGREEYER